MSNKTIISLFDHSGNWSKPYREAGYTVVQYDLLLDGRDIRLLKLEDFPKDVHGVLSAPPCTHLAIAGARHWKNKGDSHLLESLSTIDVVYRIVGITKPAWWVLENPVGRLARYIGKPRMYFQPCDYGDPYTKKTGLWGEFNTDLPKNPVFPHEGSKMLTKIKNPQKRSLTPMGFAYAFFEANP